MSILMKIKHIFAALAEIVIDGVTFYANPDFTEGAEIFDANFEPLADGTYGPYVVVDGVIKEINDDGTGAEPAETEESDDGDVTEEVVEGTCVKKEKMEDETDKMSVDVEETDKVAEEALMPEDDPMDEVRTAIKALADKIDALANQVVSIDSRLADIEKAPAEAVPAESFHQSSISGVASAIEEIKKMRSL